MKLLAIASLVSTANAALLTPGMSLVIGQKGLDFVGSTAVQEFSTILTGLALPNMDQTELTMQVTLNNLKLSDVSIDSLNLNIVNDEGIDIAINDFSMELRGDYTYRESIWPHLPNGGGDLVISLTHSSFKLGTTITATEQGHPQIASRADACSSSLSIDTIKFNGGWLSKLADKLIFNSIVDKFISKELNSLVCSQISSLISSKVNPLLLGYALQAKLPLAAPYNEVSVDFSLAGINEYSQMVQVGIVGEVFDTLTPDAHAPFSPTPLNNTAFDLESHMFAVQLTPYPIEAAYYTFFEEKLISASINKDNAPAQLPFKLNTYTFRLLLPGLQAIYPNMDMELTLEASAPANLTFSPTDISMVAPIQIVWNVVNGTDIIPAFVIECPAQVDLTLGVSVDLATGLGSLNGKVSNIQCVAALVSSTIGDIPAANIKLVNSLLTAALKIAVIPLINKALVGGFPLPSVAGLSLTQPELVQGDGVLTIKTNAVFTPTTVKTEFIQ